MRISTLVIAAFVMFIVSIPIYAGQLASQQEPQVREQFINLPTREGVTVSAWVITPGSAQASVILFAGGGGRLNISHDGIEKTGNFLIRSRYLFAAHGFTVFIPDVPSDQGDLSGFRTSEEHVSDIGYMISWLSEHYPDKAVWLVGTSRGVISTANAAANLNPDATPDGIILSASVTRPSNAGADSLQDVDLKKITVPTLFVHHEQDECYVTPFADIPGLLKDFVNVKTKTVKSYRSGMNNGSDCGAQGYHGFNGIEKIVVKDMADWILAL